MGIPLKKLPFFLSSLVLWTMLINFVRIKSVSVVVDVLLREISLQEVIESLTKNELASGAEAEENTQSLFWLPVCWLLRAV